MYVIRMLVKLLVVDPIVLCYACLVDIVRHRLNSVVVRQITKITYPVNGPMFINQVEVFFVAMDPGSSTGQIFRTSNCHLSHHARIIRIKRAKFRAVRI